MPRQRRSFGSIERRAGAFRARYMGPDVRRYEAPHSFLTRLDAEHWLAEVHREIVSGDWRPPQKETDRGSELDVLSGFARHSLAERDLTTPRTREEYTKLPRV